MKDIHSLIAYLKADLPEENISQIAIIARLLERGGRTNKHDLIEYLSTFNDSLRFYYERVLQNALAQDAAEQEAFSFDPKTENIFLNVSLTDTYLTETATRLCRQYIQAWRHQQHERRDADDKGAAAKLVRDRIPQIIAESGRTPRTRTLSGATLQAKLLDKLNEEHVELLTDLNIEEIADMLEVLIGLAGTLGYDEAALMAAVHQKRAARGGFTEGVYLEAIETSVRE